MLDNNLTKRFLAYFYKLNESIQHKNLRSFLNENSDLTETDLRNLLSYARNEGFLEHAKIPQVYRITPQGMSFLEDNDAFPKEELRSHHLIRYKVLSTLANLGRGWESKQLSEIAAELDIIDRSLIPDMDALRFFDLIKPITHHRYGITEDGLKWHRLMKLKYESLSELSKIEKLSPPRRGNEFQSLVFRAFELRLWSPEESVRTSNEEIDVIIHKKLRFYLVECKWEREPIGTLPVSHLFEKLRMRSGADGMFFSMSGFTKGAVKAVEDRSSDKLLLLFGKHDIEEMFEEFYAFEDLLETKTRELVSRRVAVWR